MTLALGLHFEGANDSTVFRDEVGHSYSATEPRIKTAEYAPITGSTSSCYFDGTGAPVHNGGIRYDPDSKFVIETGTTPFTIGMWVKSADIQTNGVLFYMYTGRLAASTTIYIFATVGAYINFSFNDGGSGITGAGNHDKTQWHYVQVSRGAEAAPNDSKVHLCVDGVSLGTINEPGLYGPGGEYLWVGSEYAPYSTPRHFKGYIDDLFFMTDVALADNFVPTVPFTNPVFWTNFVNSQELVT